MFYASPIVYTAEIVPAFSLLDRAGGTLADAILLAVIFGIVVLGIVAVRMLRKSIDNMQESHVAAMNAFEDKMADSFKQMSDSNREHINAIRALIDELKEDKAWAGECALRHERINEQLKDHGERIRELERA